MTDEQIRAAFEAWWAELHRKYPNATLETPGHMPEPIFGWQGLIAETIERAFEAGFNAGREADQ